MTTVVLNSGDCSDESKSIMPRVPRINGQSSSIPA